MKCLLPKLFLILSFSLATYAEAGMVGSCLTMSKKDTSILTECLLVFEDEGKKALFGDEVAKEQSIRLHGEPAEACVSASAPKSKVWRADQECPAENLVGVCHDESGSFSAGKGSSYFYQGLLENGRTTLSGLKDFCRTQARIFTSTGSRAEYEEAKNAIPSDLESHPVLATCFMPNRRNPEGPGQCKQYHEATQRMPLQRREYECTGDPASLAFVREKLKLNSWSTDDEGCPSKFRYAACKSEVVTEFFYKDRPTEKDKLVSKIECETSGRRYIALD